MKALKFLGIVILNLVAIIIVTGSYISNYIVRSIIHFTKAYIRNLSRTILFMFVFTSCVVYYRPVAVIKVKQIKSDGSGESIYSGYCLFQKKVWSISWYDRDSLANIDDTVKIKFANGYCRIVKHDYDNLNW